MSENPTIGIVKPQDTNLSGDEQAAVEKLQRAYHNLKAELGKGEVEHED